MGQQSLEIRRVDSGHKVKKGRVKFQGRGFRVRFIGGVEVPKPYETGPHVTIQAFRTKLLLS